VLEEALVDGGAEEWELHAWSSFQGVFLEFEDLVDRAAEDAGQQESQGEAGDIAVALDGIDTLTRDTDCGGQLLLG